MNLTMKPQKIHIICHCITIELGNSIMKQVKFNINEFKVFAFSFSSVSIGVFIISLFPLFPVLAYPDKFDKFV